MTHKQDRYSYNYNDLMKYQEVNNLLPPQLISYCVNMRNDILPNLNSYDSVLNDIITSITKGDNPNDIVFRNIVKFCINTINQNNYDEYLKKLRDLDYSTPANLQFLASELIRCSISCPIAYKGINPNDTKTIKHIPEICADVAMYFAINILNFHNEILAVCHRLFTEFMDVNKKMDEHNVYNADNYKGFMTFMGLLFVRNVIPPKIALECINTVGNAIFLKDDTKIGVCKRNNIECNNLYKGYEYILTHIMYALNSRTIYLTKEMNDKKQHNEQLKCTNVDKLNNYTITFLDKYCVGKCARDILQNFSKCLSTDYTTILKSYNELVKIMKYEKINVGDFILKTLNDEQLLTKTNISNIEQKILKLHNMMDECIGHHYNIFVLNQQYKSCDSKNQLVSPLRNYTIITHNNIGYELNKLHDNLKNMFKCNVSYVATKN